MAVAVSIFRALLTGINFQSRHRVRTNFHSGITVVSKHLSDYGIALLVSAAALGAATHMQAASAQDEAEAAEASVPAPSASGSQHIEEVIVTGSNIRRTGMEDALPVTVLNEEAMGLRDAITPVEMLTSLPQVTGVPAHESPRGSAGARGDVSTISMRGMPASASLVLLNGRRLVSHPTTGGMDYSVNVNQLPTQGLDRIDILRDGASSIYGSDAVAGVVNYITDADFTGTQVRLRSGFPENGGGENAQFTLTHGGIFANGRGRISTTIDAFYRDKLFLRDRDYSRYADNSWRAPPGFDQPGGPFDGRSTTSIYPRFRVGSSAQNYYFRPVAGELALTSVAPTRAGNPEFYGNLNEVAMVTGRSSRQNLFSSVEFDLNDSVTLFGDALFYNANTSQGRQLGPQFNAPASDNPVPMSVDNPYNPYGSHFYHPTGEPNADGSPRLVGTPQELLLMQQIIPDIPDEEVNVSNQTYRLVAGARGKLEAGWNWEIGALHSATQVSDVSPFQVRESLFRNAMARSDESAFNPFGYTFRVQDGMVVADQPYQNTGIVDYVMEPWRRDGDATLSSVDARISGSPLSLWAGDIGIAAGAEYRYEDYSDTRPPFSGTNPEGSGLDPNDNDFLVQPPTPNASGNREITSFYAEAVVPLASPDNAIPLIHSFDVTASVRHESYSDFGETTNPKFGLNWRPLPTVMVRASYNEGFSAPSLPLINASAQWTFASAPGSVDPYRNIATNEGPYITRTGSSGNPDLKPVDSKGRTIGLVFEVPGVSGWNVSVDYWEIKRSNLIGSLNASQVRNNDMLLLEAYTQEQLAAGVALENIDFGEGTDDYKGDPSVTRFAPSAEDRALFAAYNAANPGDPLAATGRVFQIDTPPINLGEGETAGWDFVMDYKMQLPVGTLALNTDWSYIAKANSTQDVPGGAPVYTEERYVNGVAKWRGASTASWHYDAWAAGVSGYYIGSFADTGATTTEAVYEELGRPDYIVKQFTGGNYVYRYKVDDVAYFNAFGSYTFGSDAGLLLSDSTIRVGVNNLTDAEPPLSSGNFGFGFNTMHTMLVPGRTWTLQITKQF